MDQTNLKNMHVSMACTVCGDRNTRKEPFNGADLYSCRACRHRFTDPGSFGTKEHYEADYFDEKHRKWFANPDIALFEYIWQRISTLGPGTSVLDIGCGNGAFLKYLWSRSKGLRLTGIDYRENEPTEGIEFIQG